MLLSAESQPESDAAVRRGGGYGSMWRWQSVLRHCGTCAMWPTVPQARGTCCLCRHHTTLVWYGCGSFVRACAAHAGGGPQVRGRANAWAEEGCRKLRREARGVGRLRRAREVAERLRHTALLRAGAMPARCLPRARVAARGVCRRNPLPPHASLFSRFDLV